MFLFPTNDNTIRQANCFYLFGKMKTLCRYIPNDEIQQQKVDALISELSVDKQFDMTYDEYKLKMVSFFYC